MRLSQKTFLFWIVLFVATVIVVQALQEIKNTKVDKFTYSKFLDYVKEQKVESVVFHTSSGMIKGEIKDEFVEEGKSKQFAIEGLTDGKGVEILREHGITPDFKHEQGSFSLQSFVMNWLPMIFFIGILFFLFKQMQAGGGKAMSFGKSKAKLLNENKNKVTFDDVAGVEEAKEELQEIVSFLKNPKKYTRLGGKIPKGVLLVGPPGTGKTLLARAVAGEAGVPFFTISGSDFVELFVGVGASRVRDLFEQGKKSAPCIIFVDEIDAVGRHRGSGMGGGHDEREQTLNQMLVEMDGFESTEGVILLAATNRPDVLDPALLRPGRFDRRVIVGNPDVIGREKILEVHSKKVPMASDVKLQKIARGTPGFSGADLANLINEGALIAARKDKSKVTHLDLEMARDKVLMGAERTSMKITEEDKKITAYHEAGHAIVARRLPKTDPIHKVTIVPRGMALGVTQFLPKEDSRNMTKIQATSLIAMMYGGRAAEEIVFKDVTTGAGNDIERATELARKMVCEWGMSDKLGPLAFEKSSGPVFLGMQQQASREYSEFKAEEIDKEVSTLVKTGYSVAMDILIKDRKILDDMAAALIEFETIDSDEVGMLFDGKSLPDIKAKRDEVNSKMSKEQEDGHNELLEKEKQAAASEDTKAKGGPVGNNGPVTA